MIKIMNVNCKRNTLLNASNLIEKWKRYCTEKTINDVLTDFKNNGYDIEYVDGDLSYWDVSDYISKSTNVDEITKAKAIFSFVLSGNHVLMNSRKCYDAFTTLIGMKESGAFSEEIITELGLLNLDLNKNGNRII